MTATTSKDMPHVQFDGVQKTYDGRSLVVKDLNLSIAKGEFLTMLGPSGSGKSTCLMMLAGFETSTFGTIYVDGKPINDTPPHKRNIGMVFQNYALFPHMSVADNLAYPLKVRKMNKSEMDGRVSKALDMVQMLDFAPRRPGQLSGGQQQRIALARALVFEPDLVLMDEPLGALDKQLREKMQYEIKHIHERLGVTIVYVTHDQSEALTMSDRVAVFNDGVIQQLAPPADLYERPENSFVAQFIGENNQLAGKVKEIRKDQALISLDNGDVVYAMAVNIANSGSTGSGRTGKSTNSGQNLIGKDTLLSIRPERVILNPKDKNIPTLEGHVQELIYLGDHIRCRMRLAGNDDFIVKIANSAENIGLNVGEKVPIGWRSQDCRALDM